MTGTVNVGTPTTMGETGILCTTDGIIGCTISDAALVGQSSVVIQGQSIGISGQGFAVISLTSAPVIGTAPAKPGFLQCATKSVGSAVELSDSARMTFSNGTVQCIEGAGFQLGYASSLGSP